METLEINQVDVAVIAIQDAMLAIIAKQQNGEATKDELYNLAVFTHALEHLKY
jgi:hypothetical protein